MKKLLINILLLCTVITHAQTVIERPTFKVRSGSINNITRIERSATHTRLYIHAIFRPGWWIRIENDYYLQDTETGKKYAITGAEGITLNKKTTMPKSGSMDFVLLFEPLPQTTKFIHCITPSDTEGNIFDISLSKPKKKQQTTLQLIRGNWFTDDIQNNWTAGFYDSIAIVHNRIYTYQSINKKGKRILLSLKDKADNQTKNITITLRKKGTCTLQQEGGTSQPLTRTDYPNKKINRDADFVKFFQTDSACIQGFIDGYDPRLKFKTGMVYLNNIITRDDYPTVVTIDPDGSFYCKFPLNHPIESMLIIENTPIPFYIEPGQTQTLYINWEEVLKYNRQRNHYINIENIQYMGTSATLSQLLKTHSSLLAATFQEKLSTLSKKYTPEAFLTYMQPRMVQWAAITDSLCNLYQNSPKAVHLMQNKLKIKEGCTLLDLLFYKNILSQKEPENKILKTKEPLSYYQFLKDMPLNDSTLLADQNSSSFINQFEFMNLLSEVNRIHTTASLSDSIQFTYPTKGILTFLKEKGVELTPTQEKMRQRDELLAGKTVYIKPKDLIAEQKLLQDLFEKEKNLLKEYTEQYQLETNKTAERDESNRIFHTALKVSQAQDSIIASLCENPMPLIWQIAKVRNLKFTLKYINNKHLASQYLQKIRKTLTHPVLQTEADKQFKSIYPDQQEETYRLPESKATEIFRRIIRNHPGKVLFVDFWATTCGPCRAGIEATSELRKQYHNHPEFQFIYITNQEDSPEKNYKEYVEKNLKGEASYYVSSEEFHYLRQLFHFNGIPHYELIEKNGSVSRKELSTHNIKEYLKKRFPIRSNQ